MVTMRGAIVVGVQEHKTLSIVRKESLQSIEGKLRKIFDSEDSFKIRLPDNLNSSGALGIEASIIQLFGTWFARESGVRILHSHVSLAKKDDLNSFEELCDSIYGIYALSMVDKIRCLESSPEEFIARPSALMPAVNTINNIRNKDYKNAFLRSRYIGIPCIKKKEIGEERSFQLEFNNPLYNQKHKVIGQEAFSKILQKILSEKIAGDNREKKLSSMIDLDDLSELLWELFSNTHEHGREDFSGNVITDNLRTIIIQQQDVTIDYLQAWSKGSHIAEAFFRIWESYLTNPATSKKLHVLDISVVDLGLGFAEMVVKKPLRELSKDEEKEATLKCFKTGWSRTGEANRGSGLTNVLQCIYKHDGWLRIRTGRVVIEKTFQKGVSIGIELEDIQFLGYPVRGSSVHISFPINRG